MVAENLTDLRAFDFGECLSAHFGIVGKSQYGIAGVSIESNCVVEVEIVGNVVERGLKPLNASFCPDKFHTATLSCLFVVCLEICFAIMRSTSSILN